MNDKKIEMAYGNSRTSSGGKGELIILYDDGTWEKLFVYARGAKDMFQHSRLLRKTRKEAIKLLQSAIDEGKIEGWFKLLAR